MSKNLFRQGSVLFVIGIIVGAFYREFTKFTGFKGATSLSLVHTHLIATGALVAIIFSIFLKVYDIEETRRLKTGWLLYLIGVIGNASILFLRGTLTILDISISNSISMSISGIAGIIHISLTVGIILFLVTLNRQLKSK